MTLLPPAPKLLRDVKTPRVLTLLYHRITDAASDPQLLSVKPHNFEQHLAVLKRSYRLAKFADLEEQRSSRTTPVNTVIVTFDDGYRDNLTEALPLLQQADIPATIFVTTSMVENRALFWWDELDYIILGEHNLPQLLELELDENFSCDLGDCQWSPELRQSYSHWSLLEETDPTVRHAIYRRISGYLRGADDDERRRVLEFLSTWANRLSRGLKCQALSSAELLELKDSDLIEIGSHTVNHPVLSKLSAARQRDELQDSKSYLEGILDREVKSFAYPYGTKADYTPETIALVRDAQYSSASVNIAEAIWPGTDRFQIPRLLVRDCNGDVFAKWLREWFGQS